MFVIYFNEQVLTELENLVDGHEKYVREGKSPCMFSVALNDSNKKGTLTLGYKTVIKGRADIEHDTFHITEGDLKYD